MKKGFTLVELSIVLVIIGLLVGGILAAQSMIASAKINATAQQISGFDASVLSFREKYKYLPGDAPSFGGDGDGVIDLTGTIPAYENRMHAFDCEIARFWSSIDPQQYTAGPCDTYGTRTLAKGAGKNVPLSKIGVDGSFFIASSISTDGRNADTTNPANYYAIMHPTQASGLPVIGAQFSYTSSIAGSRNSATTTQESFALDKKIDDGAANTGNVLSGKIYNYGGSGVGTIYADPVTSACSSGANYTMSTDYNICTPLIRIGGIAGNLQ